MKSFFTMFFAVVMLITPAIADEQSDIITVPSVYSVDETVQKLEALLNKKGATIFAKVNHKEGAQKANYELRPTILVIFGNPKIGTPVMLCEQRMGLDLPMKVLIWQDKDNKVWLTYNDMKAVVKRYDVQNCTEDTNKMSSVLESIVQSVITE